MNIPNLPHPSIPLFDPNNKAFLHPTWQLFFNQLTTQLQQNTQQYLNVPIVSTDSNGTAASKIAAFAADAGSVGAFVYNADSGTMLVNIAGTFKTVSTI